MYNVSRSLKKLGKSVGRANRASIARQVVKDERIQLKVINLLSTTLGKEMKKLCSKRVNSLLRRKDCISLQEFNIHDIVNEMKVHAPSVLTLLRGCLQGRNRSRTNKTKSRVFDEDLVVGVCCAILLRGRSQRMSLLQRVISLILYCGHASKRVSVYVTIMLDWLATVIDLQVYTRLQKLCLSLSHKAMSRCVEKLGRDFDAPTVKWRDDIMRKMSEVY